MEYVDAPSLASVGKGLSEEHRCQLVCHITDDSMMTPYSSIPDDKYPTRSQIFCLFPPSSSQAHAVLIDFSATTQTLDLDVDLSKDDYGKCMFVLINPITGFDTKWVCEYWDRDEMKRECWDANMMGLVQKEYSWKAHAVDPYKFVYDGLEPELDNNMFNV
jgi:hypothetical protein